VHDNTCNSLVADIGGTHCRFALAQQGQIIKATLATFATTSFMTFADAINHYLKQIHNLKQINIEPNQIQRSCFAIAGPIINSSYTLTNGHWRGDAKSLAAATGLKHVELINDFEAIAYSIAQLTPEQLLPITGTSSPQPGAPGDEHSIKAVIGPGTGLGTALILPVSPCRVSACEGGHTSLALQDENDLAIAHWLLQRGHSLTRETILSGAGIERLHEALCALHHRQRNHAHVDDIVSAALKGDIDCTTTLNQFCAFLGAAARDLVLDSGARGGLYIAGGVVLHFSALLQQSPFRTRFEWNPKMQDYLQNVPTKLITEPNPGLIGAAWHCQH